MSSYRVLAPCVVRQDGGESAKHYREVGEVIDVEDERDADVLIAGRFLELVEEAASEEKSAEQAPEQSADKSKSKPKPGS